MTRAVLGNWEPWQHTAGTPNLFGDGGGSGKSSWKISLFFLPDFSVEASKRIRVHRVDSVCKTWGTERVQVWVLGVRGCERPGKDEGHAVEGDERERRTR